MKNDVFTVVETGKQYNLKLLGKVCICASSLRRRS